MTGIPTWTIGIVLAAVIALTAWRLRSLSGSGAMAAWVSGTVAMGAGWDWGIVLIAYFVSSALLSRYRRIEKHRRMSGRIEKPGARDAAQVASNGGWFVLAALGHWIAPGMIWQFVGAGALAASAADTWATEVGSLARGLPRSILNGARVPIGTSGGVTPLGTAAGVAGAAFVALVAAASEWQPGALGAAMLGGVIGSLVDSFLGATTQARYWCRSCDEETERRVHHCGSPTVLRRGWRWLDNDGVNVLATTAGALVGAGAAILAR